VGVQAILFWVLAKIYGAREGIVPLDPGFDSLVARAHPEGSLITAGLLLVGGIVLGAVALGFWQTAAFGRLDPDRTMRLVIPSATLVLLAFQVAYGGFFASILGIRGTHIEPVAARPSDRDG
jgi:hypothetical protein